MRKSARKSLDELAEVMPTICELRQREFIGGQNRDCLMAQHAQPMTIDGSGGNYGGGGGGGSRAFGNSSPYNTSPFWNMGAFYSNEYDLGYSAGFQRAAEGDSSFLNWMQITISVTTSPKGDCRQINHSLGLRNGFNDGKKHAKGGGSGSGTAQEGATY